jgi:simple sugar transport system permease protein
VHALLLLVSIVLVLIAIWLAIGRRKLSAAVTLACGIGTLVLYLVTDVVPGDFTTMTPYIATLLVLALASQRLRMPAADGLPYRRGQGG